MDIGIVYHIENAHQFWEELKDILSVSRTESLSRIDNALKSFVSFCAEYDARYLQTSLQLEHACTLLFDSDIFSWHSGRLGDTLINMAASNTDPHCELIVHSTLLMYGRRNPNFFHSRTKWRPILEILMGHVIVEMDEDIGGTVDLSHGPSAASGLGVPIEARLRSLAISILYEACRVQKFDISDLRMFSDAFIEHLFDLVELTRNVDDESLNYSVIKLIGALNEQFMVAALPSTQNGDVSKRKKERSMGDNRIIRVFVRRVDTSKTFGENIIFMLNRANNSEEDLVMQLLLLKILYLLFTTPGTQQYFYTNDLRVLVDVFLRELIDLPDESEALRHTYLRVLNPLLSNTQLRDLAYKQPQIRRTLQALVAHSHVRDINSTTLRLVDRCLNAPWCKAIEKEEEPHSPGLSVPSGHSGHTMSTAVLSVDLADLDPPTPRFKTHHKSASVDVVADAHPATSETSATSKTTTNTTQDPPPSHSIPVTTTSAPSSTAQTNRTIKSPPASPVTHTLRVRTKSHGHLTRADASAALALSVQRAEANLHGGRLVSGGVSSDTEKKDTVPLAKSFPLHLSASVTIAPPVPKIDPKHFQASSSGSGSGSGSSKPRPKPSRSIGVSGGAAKRAASPGALRRKAPTPPAIPSKSKKPSAMSANGGVVSRTAVSGRGMEPSPLSKVSFPVAQ